METRRRQDARGHPKGKRCQSRAGELLVRRSAAVREAHRYVAITTLGGASGSCHRVGNFGQRNAKRSLYVFKLARAEQRRLYIAEAALVRARPHLWSRIVALHDDVGGSNGLGSKRVLSKGAGFGYTGPVRSAPEKNSVLSVLLGIYDTSVATERTFTFVSGAERTGPCSQKRRAVT